jgi:5-methylthioadenosine/S-adenosylhomocysteine deaminase
MVYAANGSAVDTVICMGEVLMENRVVPGEEEIMMRASEAAHALVKR